MEVYGIQSKPYSYSQKLNSIFVRIYLSDKILASFSSLGKIGIDLRGTWWMPPSFNHWFRLLHCGTLKLNWEWYWKLSHHRGRCLRDAEPDQRILGTLLLEVEGVCKTEESCGTWSCTIFIYGGSSSNTQGIESPICIWVTQMVLTLVCQY